MLTQHNKRIDQYLSFFGLNQKEINPKTLTEVLNALNRQEERENNTRDEWGNWEFPFTKNNYHIPYIDNKLITEQNKTIWPNNSPFALCLTHDLDSITSTATPQIAINHLKKLIATTPNKKPRLKFQLLKQKLKKQLNQNIKDPLWHYEDWLDLETSFGYSSTFFVYVHPALKDSSKYDCNYTPNDYLVFNNSKITAKEFWKELHNSGIEIGLHGSYNTYNNATLLNTQKQIIEEAIQSEIISTRQHYLHYDINTTPQIHNSVGLKIDSTLGFNRAVGFRAGSCFPYPILNSEYKETGVWEIPQIIMDGALFTPNALNLTTDLAIKKSIEIMDSVEKVGGCLTINFHPEYINNDKYWNTYKAILEEAKHRNAYNNTLKGIYNYTQNLCAE